MRTPALCLASLFMSACAALAVSACSKDDAASPAAVTPTDDAGTDAGPATPKSYDFSALDTYLFGGTFASEGLVVQHEGKIVFEKYAAGYTDAKRHITYSVSKSVGSALLGIAIDQKVIDLQDSICKWLPAQTGADPTICDTKIEHVLQMRSGLAWVEDYADPTKSNVLPLLYGGESDMGAYVALQKRGTPAGSTFSYSSGDADLLARALRGALAAKGITDMRAWAKEKLFDPAGMTSVVFEADRSGTLVFSSSCFMTPRDMVKFGQLYLDDGMVGTTRVVPSSWVAYSKTPSPANATEQVHSDTSGGSYGAAWWLNAVKPTSPDNTLEYPGTPTDMFAAEGHWGQKIFVIPSRKMVLVRVGNDRGAFDSAPMVQKAVAAVDEASGAK